MSVLLFTADDYGCHSEIDEGIRLALEKEWINSVAMFSNGPDLAASAKKIRHYQENGSSEIGCHLTITSGKPLTEEMKKCDVFVKDGHFRNFMLMNREGTFDPTRREEIKCILKAELREQIRRLEENGIVVKHLSHHHNALSFFPEYTEALMEVATEINTIKSGDSTLKVRSVNLLPREKNLFLPVVLALPSTIGGGKANSAERAAYIWALNRWMENYRTEHPDAAAMPEILDSFHYGPLGLVRSGESARRRKAKNKAEELVAQVKKYSESAAKVEIIFHLIDPSIGDSWRSNERRFKDRYFGVATNYFDSRLIEFESLKASFSGTSALPLPEKKCWQKI